MELRALGQTGIAVSVLGLGTVKFGRNSQVKYPKPFMLPTDAEIKDLLSLAHDLGINLLDTAPAYGSSEERLGQLLIQRRDWVIVSKAGEEFENGQSYFDFSKDHLKKSIYRSLKRLNTDYLDVVLLHSNGRDTEIIQSGALETLQQLKAAGYIRAIGMSTKTVSGGLLALDQSDVLMVAHNIDYTEEEAVLVAAQQANKGILVKKGLQSGHSRDMATAIQFVLKAPAVSSLIIGTLNPEHLQANCKVANLF